MTIQLRKASFRKWLRERHAAERVGFQGCPGECPLARFLISRGAIDPWVSTDTFDVARYGAGRPLPGWALRYREAVDSVADPQTRDKSVTAAHARHLLEVTP